MAIRTGKKPEMEPRLVEDHVVLAPTMANHVVFKGQDSAGVAMARFTKERDDLYLDPCTGELWYVVE